MTSIKLSYENETRRVLLRENGESLNYSKLMNTLLNLFPVLCGKSFQLTWHDDEGDLIICSSDAELEDALFVMNSQCRTLKFGVKLLSSPDAAANKAKEAASHVVHSNVTCDECGVCPIVGIRYKCAIRSDFDLCERCEAKKVQPYPMIKIADPAQAPEILIFGLRDGQRNEEGLGFGGRHWPRGFRHHHPHHHGMAPPPPPPAAANPADNNNNPCGGPGGWGRRRCGWGRKWEKFAADLARDPIPAPVAQAVAPFISALDSVVNQFTGADNEQPQQSAAAAPAPVPATTTPAANRNNSNNSGEQAQLEEQLLEQAILESLTINSSEKASQENKTQTAAPSAAYVETSKPAVPTLPKPALRFVRDVTFPDGTAVQPGAAFRKAWRVRNDGNHAWPEGASLVSVGGDVLSDPSHRESLPVLRPEQEAEIALQLVAPDLPGMYTAYFRAQTKEQQYFGQRLWAAIVVSDNESNNDWQVITEAQKPLTPVTSPLPPPASTTAAVAAKPEVEEAKENQEIPIPAPAQPEAVEPASVSVSVPVPVPAVPAEVPSAPAAPAHLRPVMLLWRRELAILSDMGFDDVEAIIPLLQQHFQSPLSLSADKNAVPNVEGMQRVVAALLTLQMN